MRWLRVLVMASLFAAPGCTMFEPQEALDDGSYEAGYGPGCNTAQHRQGGFSNYVDRDQDRYDSDRSYHSGWNAGYRDCGRPVTGPNRTGPQGGPLSN